jgi:hypothetical protein
MLHKLSGYWYSRLRHSRHSLSRYEYHMMVGNEIEVLSVCCMFLSEFMLICARSR